MLVTYECVGHSQQKICWSTRFAEREVAIAAADAQPDTLPLWSWQRRIASLQKRGFTGVGGREVTSRDWMTKSFPPAALSFVQVDTPALSAMWSVEDCKYELV